MKREKKEKKRENKELFREYKRQNIAVKQSNNPFKGVSIKKID